MLLSVIFHTSGSRKPTATMILQSLRNILLLLKIYYNQNTASSDLQPLHYLKKSHDETSLANIFAN